MGSSGLWHDIKHNPLALAAAVLLHAVLIVLLGMNLTSSEPHVPKRAPQKTVEAVVVDAAKVEQEIEKLRQRETEQQRKLKQEQDRVKQQLAAEKQRLAELKKKQDAERKKKAAEQKRQAELKKKREAERQQKLAEDKQRKAEEARIAEQKREEAERKQREAAEAKRKAAEEKRKAEEAKRLAEEKRKAEEEARRKAEEEELRRKLAEEERLEREAREAAERAARLDVLRAQYIAMIEDKVGRNWLRPASVKTMPECVLHVTQTRLGDVIDVSLRDCQGDAVYLRSIERAVRRASPLPTPPDPDVFEREILFSFRPS